MVKNRLEKSYINSMLAEKWTLVEKMFLLFNCEDRLQYHSQILPNTMQFCFTWLFLQAIEPSYRYRCRLLQHTFFISYSILPAVIEYVFRSYTPISHTIPKILPRSTSIAILMKFQWAKCESHSLVTVGLPHIKAHTMQEYSIWSLSEWLPFLW